MTPPSWWVGKTREQLAEGVKERERARNAAKPAYENRERES